MSAKITDPAHVLRFLLAGNAHATFVSMKTGTRFTYRVTQADPRPGDSLPPPHFVSVLTGPDDYAYLGVIHGGKMYGHGKKSKVAPGATSAVAFSWLWKHLSAGHLPPQCEVYHEGRCGRCARRLTTPESIELGIGPECEKKIAGMA